MRSRATIDMTGGSIMKAVVRFAIPICLGSILQQLYNTVDTLVVGNFCGTASLAAVGTGSQPVELLLNLFLGIGSGVSILVSQYTGSGERARLKDTVATAVAFLYLCAVPVSVLGLFIGPLLLRLMQVPADTWKESVAYVDIIFLGTLGNLGYNLNAGILRGLGDSRSTLVFLTVSCGVNIVLDLFFVAVLHLDVAGAALATILAMFVSWLCSVRYILKNYPDLQFSFLPRRLDRGILMQIIRIGLPLGLNNSIYSVGHILMQSLINLQGSVFIAGCSVATRLTGIANFAISSFSSAATTFAGQNLGAGRYRRLRDGCVRIPLFSGAVAAAGGAVVTLFCAPLLALFTSSPEVLSAAALYVRVVLPSFWTYAVFNCIIACANGLGDVRYPTVINLLMLWAVRIPCGWLIVRFLDGRFVMAAYTVSYVFGMVCMLFYYRSRRWRAICQRAQQSA